MSIDFTCPKCERQHRFTKQRSGNLAVCRCGYNFMVPSASQHGAGATVAATIIYIIGIGLVTGVAVLIYLWTQ